MRGVVVVTPSVAIQNGSPDGLALVDAGGTLREFLSYEGVMTALDGPAIGRTSSDINVAETDNTRCRYVAGTPAERYVGRIRREHLRRLQ